MLVAGAVLFGCVMFLAAWRTDRKEMREHAKAIHDANAAVRQEAFGSLMKRAEASETEMQRLTEKVTTLQNRVGRA